MHFASLQRNPTTKEARTINANVGKPRPGEDDDEGEAGRAKTTNRNFFRLDIREVTAKMATSSRRMLVLTLHGSDVLERFSSPSKGHGGEKRHDS